MKTAIAYLIAPHVFELREEKAAAGPNEVLIQVEACGLCPWELNHWRGSLGTCPQSLGHEAGGTIVETGPGVVGLRTGDRVTGLTNGLNGFAEYARLRADHCFSLVSNVPVGHALGEPLKCVVTVLRAAAIEMGDTAVVLGCGAMGLCCIQALHAPFLRDLVAIDVDETRLKMAMDFGATRTIDPKSMDVIEELSRYSSGRMADVVIEGTGRPDQLDLAIRCARKGRGRVVLMSSHEGPAGSFDFRPAVDRAIELRVAHPAYSLNEADDLRRAVDLLNRRVFNWDRLVTHRFRLAEIQQAFESLETRPLGYIKGVVVP
jgi:threonine dehydrogenase-like Zn-dependent dehydrogenase